MSASTVRTIHVLVQGTVQGVGFRYYVSYTARGLGLTGWVRNREDGAVDMEVQGAPDAVEAFAAAVRRGNHYSEVQNVTVQKLDPIAESGFCTLY